MAKRLFYIFLLTVLALAAAAVYLAAIAIPPAVKLAVTGYAEELTHKKLFFRSLGFDIFKGIVIEKPVLYDGSSIVARAGGIDCGLVVTSVLRNKIVIPVINVESPSVLIERKPDGTFNVSGLVPDGYIPADEIVLIREIVLRGGRAVFIDRTFPEPFEKTIENISAVIRPALPAKISFDASCIFPSGVPADIKATGEYSILSRDLTVELAAGNISPSEFYPYYAASGFAVSGGTADLDAHIVVRDGGAEIGVDSTVAALAAAKGDLRFTLNSDLDIALEYDAASKALRYSGKMDISRMDLEGLENFGHIDNMKAIVEFDNSALRSDDVSADAFGMSWKASIKVEDFTNPVMDIEADSLDGDLAAFKKMAESSFNIKFPAEMAGECDISLKIRQGLEGEPEVNGSVTMRGGRVEFINGGVLLEEASGLAEFGPDFVKWSDIGFTCRGAACRSSGAMTDFAAPKISVDVDSKDLSFLAGFTMDGKVVNISEAKGRYLDSKFYVTGKADFEVPDGPDADIRGTANVSLEDIKKIAKDSKALSGSRLSGNLRAEFELRGRVGNIAKCYFNAKAGGDVSIYGFRMTDVSFGYNQAGGSGHVKGLRAAFYGGALSLDGTFDWLSKGAPYSVTLDVKGARLEKFKADAGLGDKDVAGRIRCYAKLKGMLDDANSVTGLGRVAIAGGKLWQLNLFRGLGGLIFTSDFDNIIFNEGSCDFRIGNNMLSTKYLALKSGLIDLYGSGSIGFDKSVKLSLKSELAEEAMDPGFRKNIATAIGKYTHIDVSGTIADPKYAIRPSASDIIEDIASRLFQE